MEALRAQRRPGLVPLHWPMKSSMLPTLCARVTPTCPGHLAAAAVMEEVVAVVVPAGAGIVIPHALACSLALLLFGSCTHKPARQVGRHRGWWSGHSAESPLLDNPRVEPI